MMDRTITFIRHGQTIGNSENRYIGITDEDITKEAKDAIVGKSYPVADVVFSSPLKRCIQTAKLIYEDKNIIVIDELRETDFGAFEGKNYKELSGNADYQSWIDSGGMGAFPGGESRDAAIARSVEGFNKLLEMSRDNAHISIITHGGTIMGILSHIFGGDYYSYHVENSEGYTVDLSHDGIYSGLHFRSFDR